MAIGVLIIGKSGAGKTSSLKNFKECMLCKCDNKSLPFKYEGEKPCYTRNINSIATKVFPNIPEFSSLMIDDFGYTQMAMFMNRERGAGVNNFAIYDDIGGSYWSIIEAINKLPEDRIVYIVMHEDTTQFGDIVPRTIGKLADKFCFEGRFTIVLRAVKENGQYLFLTNGDDNSVCKSPMGMFDDIKIENDLKFVDDKIREYYGIMRKEGKEDGTVGEQTE